MSTPFRDKVMNMMFLQGLRSSLAILRGIWLEFNNRTEMWKNLVRKFWEWARLNASIWVSLVLDFRPLGVCFLCALVFFHFLNECLVLTQKKGKKWKFIEVIKNF